MCHEGGRRVSSTMWDALLQKGILKVSSVQQKSVCVLTARLAIHPASLGSLSVRGGNVTPSDKEIKVVSDVLISHSNVSKPSSPQGTWRSTRTRGGTLLWVSIATIDTQKSLSFLVLINHFVHELRRTTAPSVMLFKGVVQHLKECAF